MIEPALAGAAVDEPTPIPNEATTILFLGSDVRPDEGTRGRSDAIMLVHVNPAAQRVSMLSLPRDLWVSIPGFGEGKLNSAYFIGEQQQNGAGLAKETVSKALGIAVDHAVVVDFAGFRNLIDTLGGIPVDVPRELYDARFPTDDYGYTVAHFTPGTEVMNGERALMYSRIRHPDSDFERMRRQQSVLVGIARKLHERGALANLHEADKITAALYPFVRTDLPPALALNLLWSIRAVDPGSVTRLTAGPSILGEANIGGAYALVADPTVLQSLGTQLVAGQ